MYFTLRRRGNGRFHVASTWNTCGTLAGKLQAHSLDSHIQRVCNACLGRIKEYLRPLSMIELDVKIGNG